MNTYDTAHMLHHLRQWQSAMQAAEQRLDALSELTQRLFTHSGIKGGQHE